MKNIVKRTVSVILTLCLLMTVLVPAVWATDGDDTTGVLEYSFGLSGNAANNQIAFTAGETLSLNDNETATYFASSRTGRGGYHTDTFFGVKFQTSTKNSVTDNDAEKQQWYAIEISGVEADTYDMFFNLGKNSSGGKFKIHVLNLNKEEFFNAIDSTVSTKLQSNKALTQTENEGIYTAVEEYILNPGCDVEFDSYNGAGIASGKSLGNVTFTRDGAYVLMIQTMGASDSNSTATKYYALLSGLTMTPKKVVATVDGTDYYDNATALSAIAAATGEIEIKGKLQLTEELTTEATKITLNPGASLDLNSVPLNANSAEKIKVLAGAAIINSTGGSGKVGVASKDVFEFYGNNDNYLPLYDGERYEFQHVTLTVDAPETGDENASLTIRVGFDKKQSRACSYVSSGTTGMVIGANFAWEDANGTPGNSSGDIKYNGGTDLATAWAKVVKENSNAQVGIKVNLSGLEAVSELTMAPYIECNGVTISVDAQALKSAE